MLSSGVFLQRCICEHVRVSCVDDVCYAPVFTENEKAQKKRRVLCFIVLIIEESMNVSFATFCYMMCVLGVHW